MLLAWKRIVTWPQLLWSWIIPTLWLVLKGSLASVVLYSAAQILEYDSNKFRQMVMGLLLLAFTTFLCRKMWLYAFLVPALVIESFWLHKHFKRKYRIDEAVILGICFFALIYWQSLIGL